MLDVALGIVADEQDVELPMDAPWLHEVEIAKAAFSPGALATGLLSRNRLTFYRRFGNRTKSVKQFKAFQHTKSKSLWSTTRKTPCTIPLRIRYHTNTYIRTVTRKAVLRRFGGWPCLFRKPSTTGKCNMHTSSCYFLFSKSQDAKHHSRSCVLQDRTCAP